MAYLDYLTVLVNNLKLNVQKEKALTVYTLRDYVEEIDALLYLNELTNGRLQIIDRSKLSSDLESLLGKVEYDFELEIIESDEIISSVEVSDDIGLDVVESVEDLVFNIELEDYSDYSQEQLFYTRDFTELLPLDEIIKGREVIENPMSLLGLKSSALLAKTIRKLIGDREVIQEKMTIIGYPRAEEVLQNELGVMVTGAELQSLKPYGLLGVDFEIHDDIVIQLKKEIEPLTAISETSENWNEESAFYDSLEDNDDDDGIEWLDMETDEDDDDNNNEVEFKPEVEDEDGSILTQEYIDSLNEDEYDIEDGVLYYTDYFTERRTVYNLEDDQGTITLYELNSSGMEEGFDYELDTETNTVIMLVDESDVEEDEDIEEDKEEYMTEDGVLYTTDDIANLIEGEDYELDGDIITFLKEEVDVSEDQKEHSKARENTVEGLMGGKLGETTHSPSRGTGEGAKSTSSLNSFASMLDSLGSQLDGKIADIESQKEQQKREKEEKKNSENSRMKMDSENNKVANTFNTFNFGRPPSSILGASGSGIASSTSRETTADISRKRNEKFARFLTGASDNLLAKTKKVYGYFVVGDE